MLLSLPLEEARYAPSHIRCRHLNSISKNVREQLKWRCLFFTKDRDNFEDCLRENDVVPDKNERDRSKKRQQNKLYSKLL